MLSQHIERLAADLRLEGSGGIVGLIRPVTYSSGMMYALQLRTMGGALLVGEPTGGKPNSYGEVRSRGLEWGNSSFGRWEEEAVGARARFMAPGAPRPPAAGFFGLSAARSCSFAEEGTMGARKIRGP